MRPNVRAGIHFWRAEDFISNQAKQGQRGFCCPPANDYFTSILLHLNITRQLLAKYHAPILFTRTIHFVNLRFMNTFIRPARIAGRHSKNCSMTQRT